MSNVRSMPVLPVPRSTRKSPPGEADHFRHALDAVQVGVLTFNRSLGVLFANKRFTAMLDMDIQPNPGVTTLTDVLDACAVFKGASAQQVLEICLASIAADEGGTGMLPMMVETGERTYAVQASRIADDYWMASFDETTERRVAAASAVQLATLDTLTGLPTRQHFQDRIRHIMVLAAKDEPEPALVMLVDLDRFKTVNDTLGHPIGDALLRLVAKRFGFIFRQNDMVARLGGDEFGILVTPAPDQETAAKLARRIVDVLGRPYLIDGHLINIGASVGLASAGRDGLNYDQLLRSADLALYASKNAGRNTFSFFDIGMDQRAVARRNLEIDLRRALALRQFELHYQPQIDLDRDTLVGFEALIRWNHPERGLVSPLDFLPLAEEIGLIVALGDWVLREACQQAARWPEEVAVAVNVSPRQFDDAGRLVGSIAKALAASGLPGGRLEIEITEGVLLRNDADVLTALHQIRALGVRVAMDDFGTGYSSLSQLHSFPFDKIKIDRSFMTDRGDVDGQNAIIRAITALGVSLGMATIAEGVETSEQLARIRTEGCTSVQGYLFSKPVPVSQIDQVMLDLTARRFALPLS